MKYAFIENGIVKQVQPYSQELFIEVPDDVVCGMVDNGDGTFLTPEKSQSEIQAQLIAHYKGLYLGLVNDKLKELDYDSLATVKLWEGDATFGAEATKILTWYKSIISYNYALITSVNAGGAIPTDAEYLAGIPAYV